jgi:hypothetical protein
MAAEIPQEILDLEDEVAYENPDGWIEVRGRTIEGQSRWSTCFSRIISDGGAFYEIWWSRGSTEQQDGGVEGLEVCRVKPVEVVVTKYERV